MHKTVGKFHKMRHSDYRNQQNDSHIKLCFCVYRRSIGPSNADPAVTGVSKPVAAARIADAREAVIQIINGTCAKSDAQCHQAASKFGSRHAT